MFTASKIRKISNYFHKYATDSCLSVEEFGFRFMMSEILFASVNAKDSFIHTYALKRDELKHFKQIRNELVKLKFKVSFQINRKKKLLTIIINWKT